MSLGLGDDTFSTATYFFDELAVMLEGGKRPDSIFSDANVNTLCLHFREVFILWDGALLFAQTINLMENDTITSLHYVVAAVHGYAALHCTITPKVHLMLKHVA